MRHRHFRALALATLAGLALLIAHPRATNGTWTIMPPLPVPTQEMSVAAINNLVYVAAGSTNQARSNALRSFDPATGTWTSLAPYPGTPRDHVGIATFGGFLYLIGGVTSWPSPSVANLDRYDPATNTWSAMAPLPVARAATGVAVVNGKLYAAGGLDNGASVTTFTAYDPATNAWQTLPNMPTARDHLTGATLNGKFYALGGRINGLTCNPMNIVEIFDPAANTWSTGVPMLSAHAGHAGGSANGHIQIFGGEGNSIDCGTIAASEDFDPVTNTWTALTNMPTPRHGTGGATIGSNVYIPGGGTWTADQPTSQHERFDANGTPPPALPAPWANQDLGPVNVAGDASFSGSTLTVHAAGSDIWDDVDSFHYVYQSMSGDGQIVARLQSLANTNPDAKAGVMIRESISTGSRHAFLELSPVGSVSLLARTSGGQASSSIASVSRTAPVWLKLARTGSTFTGSVSPDGSTWTTVGTMSVSMGSGMTVGLATTSHSNSTLTTGVYDSITVGPVTGGGGPPPPGPLPSPWASHDIGAVGQAGSGSYTTSTSTFTINGAGADIWGAADSFQYTSQPINGDGTIVVRVTSLQNSNTFAKAGVMVRESLTPGSAHVLLDMRPGGPLEFMARTSTGGSTTFLGTGTQAPPAWLKLTRSGNQFAAFSSSDGSVWASIGTITVAMAASVNIGMAVTSHTSTLTAATLDNVAVVTGTPPPPPPPPPGLPAPWTDQDVGATGLAGSASYASATGTFTVRGAGADIWGTTDAFRFVYQPLNGDGEVIARVTAVQNTNTFAKAGIMIRETTAAGAANALVDLRPSGEIEFLARPSTGSSTAFVASATHAAPVWLRLSRSGGTIVASLSNEGTSWTQVGSTTVTMGNSVNVGLAVTSHDTAALNQSTFDNVSVTAGSSGPPSISFSTKALVTSDASSGTAFGAPNFTGPTSLAIGPDGRLYASTVVGKIFIATMDRTTLMDPAAASVTSVQEVNDIYVKQSRVCDVGGDINSCQPGPNPGQGRQVTGFTFGTDSTPTHIVLYVSHSGLGSASIDPSLDQRGGAITRLILEPNTATPDPNDLSVISNQDLVVGIPRSVEAHAPNGVAVGPDGWLYLTNGGNTNAGQPSNFFGSIPELYLSAAVLRLNLANLGVTLPIDVSNVNTAAALTPLANRFELYATGYRNGYDIAWHSNGKLYLNGNASNTSQGKTPGSTDGCSTTSISPGDQMDQLNLVTAGAYGGHPNPARGECVWGDGSLYSPPLSPQSNYRAPLTWYIDGASTNGIAEFTSTAFGGQMRGNLISATYAGDQNVKRVVLSADGLSVLQVINLAQFNSPLDVATEASGLIYVAEYEGNRVSLMIPQSLGACPIPGSNPSTTDSDGDGFKDADETSNGTDPCSASSRPQDFDGDRVSDLNDADDDNDGIPDVTDQLFVDARNVALTTLPIAFEWDPASPAAGGLSSSGFTGTQISSNAPRDPASGHALRRSAIHAGDAGGHLNLETDSGTNEGIVNTQMDALEIGFDSSANFEVWSRITQPFSGTTPGVGHVGGIFFGPDEDNFARLAILGTASGVPALQFAVEQAGVFAEAQRLSFGAMMINNVDVYLAGNTSAHTIQAFYVLNAGGAPIAFGPPVTVPDTWFSNNAGVNANRSLAGIVVSHGAAAPMAFGYDFFRIDRNTPGGGAPPPPANIVVYASDIPAAALHGSWSLVADATAAGGSRLSTPDANFNNNNNPVPSPVHYFDMTFTANAGVPYTLWLRMQAVPKAKQNDSLWVQFSDALAGASPIYPMNSSTGLLVNLATDASGSSLNGWGWAHGAYWLSQPTTLTFATSGTHTMRVQVREDGVQVDQLVLSPTTYFIAAPGPPTADSTIVAKP